MSMRIDSSEMLEGQGVAAVHDRLRNAILRGDFPPGEPISQVKVAQDLGVSRTPLREAIRMLEREGLLEGEPNKRMRVATFSVSDMEELYALRITIEALAIRLTVPQLSDDDLAELEDLLVTMAVFTEQENYEAYSMPHRAFHSGLVARSGRQIVGLISQLSDHSELYRRLHTTAAPNAWIIAGGQHHAILEACVARDPDLAAVRLAEHLAHTVLDNLEIIESGLKPLALRRALQAIRRSAGLPAEEEVVRDSA
jgi:DNA-binding GntR family transcriptional regulator